MEGRPANWLGVPKRRFLGAARLETHSHPSGTYTMREERGPPTTTGLRGGALPASPRPRTSALAVSPTWRGSRAPALRSGLSASGEKEMRAQQRRRSANVYGAVSSWCGSEVERTVHHDGVTLTMNPMQRPRVKRTHNPERIQGNKIRLGTIQYPISTEVQDDPEQHLWRLLDLADGSRSVEEIVQAMLSTFPDLDPPSITEALGAFIERGFMEDAGAPLPPEISSEEVDRYSRNLSFFQWVDVRPRASPFELQRRLKRSRVVVVGLGGAGSAIAMSLVAAGVGHVHVADTDRVEASNLTRQLLYTEEDIGAPKVERAVERLRKINHFTNVSGEDLLVQGPDDLERLMRTCDLLVLSADQPVGVIQVWASEAGLRTGTPWIQSGYAGPMAVLATFIPGETPCFACLSLEVTAARDTAWGTNRPLLIQGTELNAVIAPTANLSGQFAALEAIYLLTGLTPFSRGRAFNQNLLVFDHLFAVELHFQEDCPLHCRERRPTRGPPP